MIIKSLILLVLLFKFTKEQFQSSLTTLNGDLSIMLSKVNKCLIMVCMLGYAAPSSALFIIDGIDSPSDAYTESYVLTTAIEGGGTADAILRLGRGTEGSQVDNIFMLFEMPTSIHDLTFGVNTSPGWEGQTGILVHPHTTGSVHQVGSENLKFNLSGEEVKVKMDFNTVDGNLDGYKLDKDGNGLVVNASTSLDYNVQQGYLTNTNMDSPGVAGNACQTSIVASGDTACYNYLDANFSDYQYIQSYELEIDILAIDPNFYLGSSLLDIGTFITAALVHASPSKGITTNRDYDFDCLSNPTPNCTTVPEPGVLALLSLGLAGLGFSRRRVKA